MEVVRLDDYRVTPLPPDAQDYKLAYLHSKVPQVTPLKIVQPEGPSFQVEFVSL